MRGIIDKLINLGKRNDLNSRRSAFRLLQDREIVDKLFKEIAPRFKEINSGFTRIIQYKNRKGDGAPLAILELTIQKPKEKKEVKKEKKKVAPETKKKEEKLEKAVSEPKEEKIEIPPEEIKPSQEIKREEKIEEKKEEKVELKKEEKPTSPPKKEKPKFWEGIRGLFKKKKDKEL